MRFKQRSDSSNDTSAPSRSLLTGRTSVYEETRALISPTRQVGGKNLEMVARRASAIAKLATLMREHWGPLAPYRLPFASGPSAIDALCREVSNPWYSQPLLSVPSLWEWTYFYWESGGHDRNFSRLMDQMPDKNRESVRKYRETLDRPKYDLPRPSNW